VDGRTGRSVEVKDRRLELLRDPDGRLLETLHTGGGRARRASVGQLAPPVNESGECLFLVVHPFHQGAGRAVDRGERPPFVHGEGRGGRGARGAGAAAGAARRKE
jgi:hypothetical protein